LSDFDEFEDESEGREGSVELGSGKGQHEEWGGVLDEPIASFQSGRGQKANVSGLYGEDEDEDGEGSEDSTPSEYPSRQVERESPLWSGAKPGFRIHVDEGEL
jgi:hypothetical protein